MKRFIPVIALVLFLVALVVAVVIAVAIFVTKDSNHRPAQVPTLVVSTMEKVDLIE